MRGIAVIRWCTFTLLLIDTAAPFFWPRPRVGFLYRFYRDPDGHESRYALFIPHNYQADRSYPLLVYLHGSGPRTWDGIRPPREPLTTVIREQESTFDMIAVFPQSETGTWEAGSRDLRAVLGILAEVQAAYNVDPERLSLTGMSRGAFGVWSLAAAYPDKWAAIVPVCGGGNPQDATKIRGIPCWCFHGALDKVVPVEESRRMIQALRAAGAAPRYEEYADLAHNRWERAYRTPDLFPWIKGQKSVR